MKHKPKIINTEIKHTINNWHVAFRSSGTTKAREIKSTGPIKCETGILGQTKAEWDKPTGTKFWEPEQTNIQKKW